jgi:hypothetical protein
MNRKDYTLPFLFAVTEMFAFFIRVVSKKGASLVEEKFSAYPIPKDRCNKE